MLSETVLTLPGGYEAVKLQLDSAKVSGEGGPVYPRLVLPIHLHSVPQASVRQLVYLDLQAELHTEPLGKIADSVALMINLSVDKRSRDWSERIELPLDLYRIEKLEQHREDEMVLRADVRLGYRVQWEDGRTDFGKVFGTMLVKVSQSDWINNVLPGLGYGIVKVVELPAMTIEACDALSKSFQALENAQEYFKLGLYDEAAGRCRIALEPFFEQVEKPDGIKVPSLKASWEKKLGTATYNWLGQALGAIKMATNPLHHSPTARFSRLDAQMILSVTIAVISYAARSYSGPGVLQQTKS